LADKIKEMLSAIQLRSFCLLQSVRLLEVQTILSADTGISRQTEGHSFGDHLSIESVHVTPSSMIEASTVLCYVFITRVSQCPIRLRAEHPIVFYLKNMGIKIYKAVIFLVSFLWA
jgi:hypothetical protein